jgi:hypothetical protein
MVAGRRVGDGEGYSDVHLGTAARRRIRLAWAPPYNFDVAVGVRPLEENI